MPEVAKIARSTFGIDLTKSAFQVQAGERAHGVFSNS